MYDHIRAGIAWVMLLVPATAWAAHPLEVENTATEGKGNYAYEATADLTRDDNLKSTKLTNILTVAGGENTDFSLEVPYRKLEPSPVIGEDASGAGNVRVTMKQQLFENEVKQSMAYLVYVDVPTGDLERNRDLDLGTKNVLWGIMLVDSQVCCSNAFHVHLGYEVFGKDVKQSHFAENYAIKFGFAAEHKLSDAFHVMAEFAGENRKATDRAVDSSTRAQPFTFLAGVYYDISKSWRMDLGTRIGLNKYAEDQVILAATAWKF